MVLHKSDWNVPAARAIEIQKELSLHVIEQDELGAIRYVAGVDVGFEGEGNRTSRAAVVVLDFPTLVPVEYSVARQPVTFPYIPGLLAFREAPVILKAVKNLERAPSVILVDGHGRAHPRRMGIACHIGVALDVPTIGCAKSILTGKAVEPRQQVGAWTPLNDRGETIGAALRTRVHTKPIYISIGHRVSLERAIDVVLSCCRKFRVPETTRFAHRVASGERIDLRPRSMEQL